MICNLAFRGRELVRQSRDVNGQNQEVWESWLSALGCSERTFSDLGYHLDAADGLLIPFLSRTGVGWWSQGVSITCGFRSYRAKLAFLGTFSTTKEAKDPLEGFTIGHNKARSET